MTTPNNYESGAIALGMDLYSGHQASVKIYVDAELQRIDGRAAVLVLSTGAARLQLYPSVDQLDEMIKELQAARTVLAARLAAEEVAS